MEPESSSPYPQVPATSPYPEPTPSSPHDPLQLPQDPSNIILPSTSWSPQWLKGTDKNLDQSGGKGVYVYFGQFLTNLSSCSNLSPS